MLGVPERATPFLRRAFSVANTSDLGAVRISRQDGWRRDPVSGAIAVGIGSDDSGAARQRLFDRRPARPDRVAIVAGGVGVAAFPLLLRDLASRDVAVDVFFGGRTAAEISYRHAIAPLTSGELLLSTDDGSLGFAGRVTELLERNISAGRVYKRLYACGPTPMFRTLERIVAEHGLPAEFSTEAPMGCGFGVCLACVLPRPGGGFLVSCQEGPILAPSRIDWGRV